MTTDCLTDCLTGDAPITWKAFTWKAFTWKAFTGPAAKVRRAAACCLGVAAFAVVWLTVLASLIGLPAAAIFYLARLAGL